ncbi:MAG: ABC transporter permease [Chitinophagaceae bacterium]
MSETQIIENWTEVISPKKNLFDVRLKEVWRYRDLIFLFVKRDIIAQYKQTVLGPLWNIIQPILTTIMFMIVFNKIAGISTDKLPPVLFYMSSITIWNYFSACLTTASSTFTVNANIFGKVYFPRLALPIASVVSNMARFGIQFALLLSVIIYYQLTNKYFIQIGWHTLLIPLIAIEMALLGLGLGIIISSLTTKYRDFTVLITFGVQLLMYITPVAYPLSFLQKSGYKNFIQWNPLSPLVEGFRYAVFGVGTVNTTLFLYSAGFTLISLFAGIIIFNKVERNFMDTV